MAIARLVHRKQQGLAAGCTALLDRGVCYAVLICAHQAFWDRGSPVLRSRAMSWGEAERCEHGSWATHFHILGAAQSMFRG